MSEPSTDEREAVVEEVRVIVHAAIADAYEAGQKSRPAVDVEAIARVLGEHVPSGGEMLGHGHPWKARCKCGTWFYLLENHQAEVVVAYLAGEGR